MTDRPLKVLAVVGSLNRASATRHVLQHVARQLRDRGAEDWEVRVNFAGGASRVFRYPTDPGFLNGERVRFEAGRLTRM